MVPTVIQAKNIQHMGSIGSDADLIFSDIADVVKNTKLAALFGWDEAAANKIMLKQIGDPLHVFLIGFLSFGRFDEFRMADYHMTGFLQNVMDWNPVFSCGFHADIFAVACHEPVPQFSQASRIGGKPTRLVLCGPLRICGCNAGNQKILVNKKLGKRKACK